jgi:hypothetical protein
MKLGKTHLVASLAMVAASIAYNVWVFTRPARRSAPVTSPVPFVENGVASGPVVTGEETVASIDPTTVAPPPDVDLSSAPEWRRNPFATAWQQRADTAIVPAVQIDAEPDLVVGSILHSADRRLAVVNGRIVRAGDRVGSSTIVDIQPRAVIVESSRGVRRHLELRMALTRADASAGSPVKAEVK